MVRAGLLAGICLVLALSARATPVSDDIGKDWEDIRDLRRAGGAADSAAGERDLGIAGKGLVLGIRAYQEVLSSQDVSSCNFTPSCSRYGQAAVSRYGILGGLVLTSDRLQRCHPGASGYYPHDHRTGRGYDPVSFHGPREGDRKGRGIAAGLMSAVIPGSGKVYAGRTYDGLASLVSVGLAATFSATNFHRDGSSSFRGWAFGVFAVFLYAGNIYGSYEAAARPPGYAEKMLEEYHLASDRRVGGGLHPETPALAWQAPEPGRSPGARDEDALDVAKRTHAAGEYSLAAVRYLYLASAATDPDVGRRALLLQPVAHAENHSWEAAMSALDAVPEGRYSENVSAARRAILDHQARGKKSPRKASIMSAFLPGSGQAYAGHWARGLSAACVTGATGYYLVRTFQTESYFEAVIVAIPLFLRYYLGNIGQAGRLAVITNQDRDEEAVRAVILSFGLNP